MTSRHTGASTLAPAPEWVANMPPAALDGYGRIKLRRCRGCCMSGRVPALVLHVWQAARRGCCMSGRVPALVLHVRPAVGGAACLI